MRRTRDAELVDDLGVERDEVVEAREDLAEPDQVDCRQGIEDALEGRAVPGCVHAEGRRAAALEAEAAQVLLPRGPLIVFFIRMV